MNDERRMACIRYITGSDRHAGYEEAQSLTGSAFIVHRSACWHSLCKLNIMEKSGEGTLSPREAWEQPKTEAPDGQEWSSAGPSAKVPGKEVPDERIRQDVCDRLVQFGLPDCTELDVSVAGGVVTVTGTMPSRAIVDRALEVIRSVAGVRDIGDKLRVNE